jgi:hypothetical protein
VRIVVGEALVSVPLPECQVCDRPTARAAHERHNGLCSACCRAYGCRHGQGAAK